jgi:hypothetical protein
VSSPAQKSTVTAQPLIAVRNVRASSQWYAELLGADSLPEHSHRDVYDRISCSGQLLLLAAQTLQPPWQQEGDQSRVQRLTRDIRVPWPKPAVPCGAAIRPESGENRTLGERDSRVCS